jgi:hypothetical protein
MRGLRPLLDEIDLLSARSAYAAQWEEEYEKTHLWCSFMQLRIPQLMTRHQFCMLCDQDWTPVVFLNCTLPSHKSVSRMFRRGLEVTVQWNGSVELFQTFWQLLSNMTRAGGVRGVLKWQWMNYWFSSKASVNSVLGSQAQCDLHRCLCLWAGRACICNQACLGKDQAKTPETDSVDSR